MLPQLSNQLNGSQVNVDSENENASLISEGPSNMTTIAGIVNSEEVPRLRRLIFRASRGQAFVFIEEVSDEDEIPIVPGQPNKSVYIIMFYGSQQENRLSKICDSFTSERFEIPDSADDITEKIREVKNAIVDSKSVLSATRRSLRDQLSEFDRVEEEGQGSAINQSSQNDGGDDEERKPAPASTIYIYKMFLAKEKALSLIKNMVKWQDSTFIGFFWAPVEDQNLIEAKLSNYPAVRVSPHNGHNIKRPTYIKTNDVTWAYQYIVDTYGIPNYLEANPALLTIVTFPFFFGMMFGDMGHGSLVLIGGMILTIGGKDFVKGGMFEAFGMARHLILLMGIMAFYCGFIYNEWFAIPTNLFGSCYDINKADCVTPERVESLPPNGDIELVPCESTEIYRRADSYCVYPLG